MMIAKEIIDKHKAAVRHCIDSVDSAKIAAASDMIATAAVNGQATYVAGNGACAALSEHWACDHMKGASTDRHNNTVHSLASNMAIITAIGNDIDFEEIFSYQLGRMTQKYTSGVLVLLSASGKSPNIINAALFARAERPHIKIISVTGFGGEPLSSLSDINIHIDAHEYEAVEDIQSAVMHMLAKCVRAKLNSL